jgi:hypothetical protein
MFVRVQVPPRVQESKAKPSNLGGFSVLCHFLICRLRSFNRDCWISAFRKIGHKKKPLVSGLIFLAILKLLSWSSFSSSSLNSHSVSYWSSFFSWSNFFSRSYNFFSYCSLFSFSLFARYYCQSSNQSQANKYFFHLT